MIKKIILAITVFASIFILSSCEKEVSHYQLKIYSETSIFAWYQDGTERLETVENTDYYDITSGAINNNFKITYVGDRYIKIRTAFDKKTYTLKIGDTIEIIKDGIFGSEDKYILTLIN